MNDIVERLRARAKSLRGMGSIAHVDADTDDEAADEITHLRKKVEWHTHAVHTCHAECDRPLCQTTRERDTLRAENERLKAALTKIGRYEVPPVPVPWTHAVAADTYWIGIDYMRHTARAALKENSDE